MHMRILVIAVLTLSAALAARGFERVFNFPIALQQLVAPFFGVGVNREFA